MLQQLIPYTITTVGFLLLAFIAMVNPMRVNITANKWFGVFLFSVACLFLNNLIYTTSRPMQYWHVIVFNELSRFLIAPALYLSVLHYTSTPKVIRKREWLHFIPFFIFGLYMGPAIWQRHTAVNLQVLSPTVGQWIAVAIASCLRIQLLVYWCMAYYRLSQHQKNIKLIASNTNAVDLKWLNYLLWSIAAMILLGYVSVLIHLHPLQAYAPFGYMAGMLIISCYLLAQKEIYPFDLPVLAEVELTIRQEAQTETKSRFTSDEMQHHQTRLTNLMQTEKVYLDNELSLPELARYLELSTHDLSYVLNDGMGVNFFQYINHYRVNEAKQLMLSEQHKHLNILGIAYSAGFNSKTTFNTAFKKETGMSPTPFIRQVKAGTEQAFPAQ